MRQITVYSTRGGLTKINSDAKVWGDLKAEIEDQYDLSSLIATEGKNKTTLESSEAVLPEGDFVLFLRPKKFKAGANLSELSFKQLRALLTDEMKNEIKKRYHRSWTNLSTELLIEFLLLKKQSDQDSHHDSDGSDNDLDNRDEDFDEEDSEDQEYIDALDSVQDYILDDAAPQIVNICKDEFDINVVPYNIVGHYDSDNKMIHFILDFQIKDNVNQSPANSKEVDKLGKLYRDFLDTLD